jgi:hypothetical protein
LCKFKKIIELHLYYKRVEIFREAGARGAKVPFQFKGLRWRNRELSERLVQLFYEFASENARNAVIELQE